MMSKRILTVFTMVFLLLLLASLFTACGGTAVPTKAPEETAAPTTESEETAPPAFDGQALLQERCTTCHDLATVEQAKQTEDEWKATVENMVARGAQLNEEEQKLLIEYLAEMYPK
ncbi:MAG: hypothetical protein SVX38_07495 [Chloroflexota bacterium]|nr:hypothetical protein [Chloroflexota bacterium]